MAAGRVALTAATFFATLFSALQDTRAAQKVTQQSQPVLLANRNPSQCCWCTQYSINGTIAVLAETEQLLLLDALQRPRRVNAPMSILRSLAAC